MTKGVKGCTYSENGHHGSLQEANEHVTPVVHVVRHTGQGHIHGRGQQEELDGGAQQPGPFILESGLDVQLQSKRGTHKRHTDTLIVRLSMDRLSVVFGL